MLEKMLDDVSENLIDLEDTSSYQEEDLEDFPEDNSSDQEEVPDEVPEELPEDTSSDQEEVLEEITEDTSSDQEEASPENNYFYYYSTSENTVSGNFVTVEQLAVFDTTVIFLLACVLGALIFNAFMKKL